MATAFDHTPVMLDEIIETFATVPSGTFVDATLGGAGHARCLLEARHDLRLVGIDRDPDALAAANAALAPFEDRVVTVLGRFDELAAVVATHATAAVTAVLFDLGVSSPQFDTPERGFSYRAAGPLSMRMDQGAGLDAAEIVNTWPEADLAEVISAGSDERFAKRIAAAIVNARPVTSTDELAEIVKEAIPAATRRHGGHPAKRTFQALRIAVNDELDQLAPALKQAIEVLAPGGRGAVISYHSGEDRIVKEVLGEAETGSCACPTRLPCVCGAEPTATTLRPRSRTASEGEITRNPRSRSARLRCWERTGATT